MKRIGASLALVLWLAAPASATQAPLFEHWRTVVRAGDVQEQCEEGLQPGGALFRICTPTLLPWTGELVVYAHGYRSPAAPLELPDEAELIGPLFTLRGMAFATTSFRANGLAVPEAVADLEELLAVFGERRGAPARVWLVGASHGALIATLALERGPHLYDGALAMCGPIGSFAAQVDYVGDFRVVFDVLFPGLLEPSAVEIPAALMEQWGDRYATLIHPALADPADAARAADLFAATGVAFDPADATTRERAAEDLLWYNVFATNDGNTRLGGQAFENRERAYTGSTRDAEINALAARFAADPAARIAIADAFETSGAPQGGIVTLHTTLDPIVPHRQALLYADKIDAAGAAGRYEHRTVERYGHCNLELLEVTSAFERMVELSAR